MASCLRPLTIVLTEVSNLQSSRPLRDAPAPPAGGARRVARNFGLLLTGELVAQALGFFLLAYLARALGADGFGVWTFAAAVVAYFMTVVEAGTDSWGVREVSREPGRLREVLGGLTAARLAVAVAATVVLLAYAGVGIPAEFPARRWALLFGTLSLAAVAVQTTWAYRSVERVVPIAAASVVQRALAVGLALLLVHSAADGPRAMLLQGLSELVVSVGLLVGMWRLAGGGRPTFRGGLARRALGEAWPMGASRMVRSAMAAFTVAILAHSSSNATVGHYGAAFRLVMALLTINTIFSMAAMPSIVRACSNAVSAARTVSAAHRVLVAIYLPVVVGGGMLAAGLLELVYSREFVAAAVPLRILLAMLPVSALSENLRSVLVALGRQRDILWSVGGAAIVTVILAATLSPLYGATGAASAVLAGETTLFVLASIFVRRRDLRLPLAGPLMRPALAAGAMAVALHLLDDRGLPTLISVGAVVYAAVLFGTRGITPSDLRALDTPPAAA